MKKVLPLVCIAALVLLTIGAAWFSSGHTQAALTTVVESTESSDPQRPIVAERPFEVQVLVNGSPLAEYYARGRSYVEATEGAEYEVRIHNPLPYRVAVALSVDGLNSIDARRTTAWNASKWVIGPYDTIEIGGWQMSSERARRFYFTTERDSYAAKLGQASNLGVISAVFFRERRPMPVRIAPPPRPVPGYEEDGARDRSPANKAQAPSASGEGLSRDERRVAETQANDDYAATGIGRSVRNDVRFVDMDLESRPTADLTLRYEYYPALVRLGILPRPYPRPDTLRRREGATGFEDRRFSPEP